MVLIGALRPSLPSPVAVPLGYFKIIIDLKDCFFFFFTVTLHPDDQKRFACSLPSPNFQARMRRYQWCILPQGMADSPTLCQSFLAAAMQTVRDSWPQMCIIHYMDGIPLAEQKGEEVLIYYKELCDALVNKEGNTDSSK